VAVEQLTPVSGPAPEGAVWSTHVTPPSALVAMLASSKVGSAPTATHVVAVEQLTLPSGPVALGAVWSTHEAPPSLLVAICAEPAVVIPTVTHALVVGQLTLVSSPTGGLNDALTCHPEVDAPASVVTSTPAPTAITMLAMTWPMRR
jgi:hypothetical protein